MHNLEDMTIADLKQLAKENNIKNISKLKKEELVNILKQIQNKTEETVNLKYDSEDDEAENLDELNESVITYQVNNEEDEIIEGILEV